jgi:hypothetical protein
LRNGAQGRRLYVRNSIKYSELLLSLSRKIIIWNGICHVSTTIHQDGDYCDFIAQTNHPFLHITEQKVSLRDDTSFIISGDKIGGVPSGLLQMAQIFHNIRRSLVHRSSVSSPRSQEEKHDHQRRKESKRQLQVLFGESVLLWELVLVQVHSKYQKPYQK